MDIVTLLNIFNCYSSIFPMFPKNEQTVSWLHVKFGIKTLIWRKLTKTSPHGGLIGYGNSILDFFLARSKVFRLHAILRDSAGAVKATTNQGPGYCYMLPQFPSSCLLGHITGLFFCIFIKICHPRNFKMLDC